MGKVLFIVFVLVVSITCQICFTQSTLTVFPYSVLMFLGNIGFLWLGMLMTLSDHKKRIWLEDKLNFSHEMRRKGWYDKHVLGFCGLLLAATFEYLPLRELTVLGIREAAMAFCVLSDVVCLGCGAWIFHLDHIWYLGNDMFMTEIKLETLEKPMSS